MSSSSLRPVLSPPIGGSKECEDLEYMRKHSYFVYILGNNNDTLYNGVTSNLTKRLAEHQDGTIDGFTQKYVIHKLLYFEEFADIALAIAREKQLKHWKREWKLNLIRTQNPELQDVSKEFAF